MSGRSRLVPACILALVALVGGASPAPPAPPRLSAQGALDKLLAVSHGLAGLSSGEKAALQELRRDPAATTAALDARFPASELQLLERGDASFERAVLLLDALDHPAAERLLARWFLNLQRMRRESPQRPAYDRIVLAHLAGAYDASVVESLLGGLEGFEFTDRLAALRYLTGLPAGHGEIAAALSIIYAKPSSPLHRDELLARALELLEKGRRKP